MPFRWIINDFLIKSWFKGTSSKILHASPLWLCFLCMVELTLTCFWYQVPLSIFHCRYNPLNIRRMSLLIVIAITIKCYGLIFSASENTQDQWRILFPSEIFSSATDQRTICSPSVDPLPLFKQDVQVLVWSQCLLWNQLFVFHQLKNWLLLRLLVPEWR